MLPLPLTDPDYIREVLSKNGVEPKKSMGQNFLICPEVLEATTLALGPDSKKVTELGAGLGALTQGLLQNNFSVRAIEKDDTLVQLLRSLKNMEGSLEIKHGDLRDIGWSWEKEPYQLVGNIPYNLTGLIIRRITEQGEQLEQAVLLVQQEVAGRILAQPPHMNLMALAVQLWGDVQLLVRVPASCFWPQPKISSALIVLTAKNSYPKRNKVMKFARGPFQTKRKQLAGSVRRSLNMSESDIQQMFDGVDIPKESRPQELTRDQWIRLYESVESARL